MDIRRKFNERRVGYVGELQWGKYAVLVPFVRMNGKLAVLFQKRSAKLSAQPGDISFPGGRKEEGESAKDCAIRETMEEMLVERKSIDVIGPSDIFIAPSGKYIEPFIGSIANYSGTFSTDEVDEVFTIPYEDLKKLEPRRYINRSVLHLADDFPYEDIAMKERYPWRDGDYLIQFYYWENRVIWGMTARILERALELFAAYDLENALLI